MFLRLLLIALISAVALFAKPKSSDKNSTLLVDQNTSMLLIEARISDSDKSLDVKKNIWLKKHSDFQTYKRLLREIDDVKERIANIKRKKYEGDTAELKSLLQKEEGYKKQLLLLGDYKIGPLGDLVIVGDIVSPPEVRNPFAVIFALSYIKQLSAERESYESKLSELVKTIDSLRAKRDTLAEYVAAAKKQKDQEFKDRAKIYDTQITVIEGQIIELDNEKESFESTIAIFTKKSGEITQKLQSEIKAQLAKLFNILVAVAILIGIMILLKLLFKRYMVQFHERAYIANKIINAIVVTLIVMLLLFSYIDNVSYLVTILGFASAGIAIAMKDWFMSALGWIAITASGSIKVGDRIKLSKDTAEILGDVLDISLLKITLYEEVSWVSIEKNHRAGRIIFIPNNLIFTHIFFNYTHAGLNTIWDGINITITFDSNLALAMQIVEQIAQKHSRQFSRLTDKQTGKLRTRYSMREISSQPRLFTLIEPHGITVSVWYLSNSYTLLQTKSIVSREIIASLNMEPSIHIAYPTTTIRMAKGPSSQENPFSDQS